MEQQSSFPNTSDTTTLPALLQYANQVANDNTNTTTNNDFMVSTDDWYNDTTASLFTNAEQPSAHRKNEETVTEKSFTSHDLTMECQQTLQADSHQQQTDGVLCNTCKRSFKSLASLNKHIKSAHNENAQISADEYKFQCDECGKMYSKKKHLQSHIRAVHTNEKFKCEVCGKLYSWEANLQAHILRIHRGKAPTKKTIRRKCDECNVEFTSNKLLDEHMVALHNIEPFPCKFCDKRLKCQTEYSTHLRNYHRNLVNNHACEICGMMYHTASRLQSHVDRELHKPVEIGTASAGDQSTYGFRCIACGEEFGDKTVFGDHLKTHRTATGNTKRTICKICNQSIHSGSLKYHMKSHSGIRDVACDSCDYKCRSLGDLKKHKRTHTGERPYPCAQCGRRFTNSSCLNLHVRRHNQEHTHICKVCNKGFYSAKCLENHEALHTGNWSHVCVFCQKRFRRRGTLRTHVNSVHKGLRKPFMCIGCMQNFATDQQLHEHMKLHEGVHFCNFCRKSFATEDSCKLHEAIHISRKRADNSKQYVCPECPLKFHSLQKLGEHYLEHDDALHCTVCGETFTTRLFVVGHLQGKHPKEFKLAAMALSTKLTTENLSTNAYSSYSCCHCDQSFTIERNLEIHERIHKDARPYGCPYCYHSYSSDKELKDHQETSHKQVLGSLKQVHKLIVKSLLSEIDS